MRPLGSVRTINSMNLAEADVDTPPLPARFHDAIVDMGGPRAAASTLDD